jgi:predicted nucleic acid-binding protein
VIVVDASVLIAHLDDRDALHDRAVECLLDVAEHPLGCSPLTLAEVLVGPARHRRLEAARAAIAGLEITALPLGDDAPARLAQLRANTGLRLPDCCVLLAAEDADARAVLTFDDGLARAGERLGFKPG